MIDHDEAQPRSHGKAKQGYSADDEVRVRNAYLSPKYPLEIEEMNAIHPLQQLFMPLDKYFRNVLVRKFAELPDSKEATRALVRIALFDLDAENRLQASTSLKKRSAEDYVPTLLQAVRYPWMPVVNNALAVLAENHIDAAPQLTDLLEQSDPDAPFLKTANSRFESSCVSITIETACYVTPRPISQAIQYVGLSLIRRKNCPASSAPNTTRDARGVPDHRLRQSSSVPTSLFCDRISP